MTAPPLGCIALSVPANIHDHFIKIKDVAAAVGAKSNTITWWCGIAAASGFNLIEKHAHRRLFNPHGAYVIAVLASISRVGIGVSVDVLQAVLHATHDGSNPRVPHLFEQFRLVDGPAVVDVDLSKIWLELEPTFQELK